MSLPYENATSGSGALDDIRKLLTRFGCDRFGTMTDAKAGELIVQFTHHNRDVTATASYRGYANALLKDKPFTHRTRVRKTDYESKALKQAEISVCSILRDWIKGQVTAIECGVLTFDEAFLGQIILPSGKTVLEVVKA